MIKLNRTPEPAILARKGASWAQSLAAADTQAKRATAQTKYRHPEIKNALVAMTHGKCAYCESKITHVDYGDIEHYRPKSRFPLLTFAWDNLLLSCRVCNGAEHKGDRFPEAVDGGPILDPSADDPAKHLRFVYDRRAGLATVVGKTARGKTTVRLLGLNRPELRARRSFLFKAVAVAHLSSANDPEAKALLTEALSDDGEYLAFMRRL